MTKPALVSVFVLLMIGFGALVGIAQSRQGEAQKHIMISPPHGLNVGLTADSIERHQPDLNVWELAGNVEIRSRDMSLRADRAVYDQAAGEIKPSGNVRIKMEPQE